MFDRKLFQEGARRLKILEKQGVTPGITEKLTDEGSVFCTFRVELYPIIIFKAAILYNVLDLLKYVEEFEEDNNAFVYYCILSRDIMGDWILYMLYVTEEKREGEWEFIREGLKDHIISLGAYNIDGGFTDIVNATYEVYNHTLIIP